MVWLMILLVLMLMVGPVMWLRPGPRQRRIVPLRNAANKAGVKVALEKPPLHDTNTAMPAYRWYFPAEAPGPRFVLVRDSEASEVLKFYQGDWRWRIEPLRLLPAEARETLASLLSRLPQDALVVESSEAALTLWWWESQGAERFLTYEADFRRLRDALAGHADRPQPSRFLSQEPGETPKPDEE
ncbi:preprotein translocase subunit YajC [Billgrantia saliphila]|uniref:preprotein translocase subunit YajC n=1 Tax=Billgrantia saliphila TaxID=1848458 RepID=UPI000CE30CB9|nr:preprotein translocase subunit YajC [Halomonas saliphila]